MTEDAGESLSTPPIKLIAMMVVLYTVYAVFLGSSMTDVSFGTLILKMLTFDLATEPFLMPTIIAIPISLVMFGITSWTIIGLGQKVSGMFPESSLVMGEVGGAIKLAIGVAVAALVGGGFLYILWGGFA